MHSIDKKKKKTANWVFICMCRLKNKIKSHKSRLNYLKYDHAHCAALGLSKPRGDWDWEFGSLALENSMQAAARESPIQSPIHFKKKNKRERERERKGKKKTKE